MPFICHKCINDVELKKIVKREKTAKCSNCDSNNEMAIDARRLGEIMEPTLRRFYTLGEEQPRFTLGGMRYEQGGESLMKIVEDVLGQWLDCIDVIAGGVIAADVYWPQDGEGPFWSDESYYERIIYRGQGKVWSWEATLDELKHSRRFFSPSANNLFTELFSDLGTLRVASGVRRSQPVVRLLPKGSLLYRARSCDMVNEIGKIWNDPLKFVGPPPPEKARAGRMNAEGVVVLYCAKDVDTCLAEMRPALGGELALITLQTQEPLRILDFSLLEKRFVGGASSIFDPQYSYEFDRRQFLKRLHHLISQPITPGREADYLITQTMAEYLSHVHDAKIDGISFSSAQRKNGVNVVLFPARDLLTGDIKTKFGVDYVDKSIKGYRTKAIQYSHSEIDIFQYEDGSFVTAENYDPDLDFEW